MIPFASLYFSALRDLNLAMSSGGSRISLGGGANPGGPTYDFGKFSQKLHEIERILTRRVPVPRAPLDPAMMRYIKIQ